MSAQPASNKSSKGGIARRLAAVVNGAVAALSYRFHLGAANAWRDTYNPLRSLTIARAVMLLEEGERGAYANLQWTYRFIEMQDATLGALIERRTSAIKELDWSIKVQADLPAGKIQVAKRQQAALEVAYNGIGNLYEAFGALAMATFRGYTRLEKVRNADGDITELAPVDQWFWCRRGIYGPWTYNRNSTIGQVTGEDVDEMRFVCREVERPVNRVALIAFVRKALSQKDWDGFIEAYGIPAVFIIMPPDVPEEKADEYLETASQVVGEARGALPNGSDIKTVDNGARGVNPFRDHLKYQDEQLVLRGTGGKLTMLAESGSGTLAGDAHSETFAAIARSEAKEISETLRLCIDKEILARVTPGEDAYAYFELSANEETEPAQLVKDIAQLENAGLETDVKWIAEKTGYPVTRRTVQAASVRVTETAPNPNPAAAVASLEDAGNPGAVMNRETTFRAWIAGLRNREAGDILAPLEAAAQDPGMSDAQFLQHAQSLIDSLKEIDPQAAEQMAADLDAAMTKAAVDGVKQAVKSE